MDDRLDELLRGLKSRDPVICGDAPPWIVEMVEKNLEALTSGNRLVDRTEVADFCRGAGRFITDSQAVEQCDLLLQAIERLLK